MQASDTFRSRRPPSPHGPRQTLTTGLPTSTARFPQPRYVEEGQTILSADDKLEAVRHDPYAHPSTFPISTSTSATGGRSWRGGLGRITSGEWKVIIAVVLVACSVRLFRLGQPDSVVFDEVHFGKFAGKYIRTRYYVDVHPPLAKLLITLTAWIGGYNGMFFIFFTYWIYRS
jgi:dolichyl-phosphate-mannose-protein mannosyltransferase